MPCCVVIFVLIGQWFRFLRAVKRLFRLEDAEDGDDNAQFDIVLQAPPRALRAYGQPSTLAR